MNYGKMIDGSKKKRYPVADQFWILVERDFKLKYNSTALGFLWSVLVPVCQGGVYFLVFSSVGRFGVENYLLYMLSGMFLWHFIANCCTSGRRCFVGNGSLIKKTCFPRSLLVWSRVMTEFIHLLLTIPILLLMMLYFGVCPGKSLLLLPVLLAAVFAFAAGLTMIVGVLNLYLRDLERILSVVIQMWFFASPIFYQLNNLRGGFSKYVHFNPAVPFLLEWRDMFYRPAICSGMLLKAVAVGMATLILGLALYRWRERDFAEKI